MDNFNVSSVSGVSMNKPIDTVMLRRVLASASLSDKEKANFINSNRTEIKNLMQEKITSKEFVGMMQDRPLIRFRPFKNSYTKQGDKILLAKAVGIEPKEVNGYVQHMAEAVKVTSPTFTKDDNIEKVQSYVYRHGSKDQVVAFLGHELSNVENVLESLYKTLEDNSGGLADYFSRPIHRMDNITLSKLFNTIDKSLDRACRSGAISHSEMNSTSEWTLVRIYEIQNNSKLIRAVNAYKALT